MVIEIPTPDDFREYGIDYLNLGWGTVLNILTELEEARDWIDVDESLPDVWKAAERELATALSLVQQGSEFLLKSKICEVSPWILVISEPRHWPKGCDLGNIKFSQFRTIDAQDLIKVFNTVCNDHLDQEFCQAFEALRQMRNSVAHAVDRSMAITAKVLIEHLLVIAEHLLGPQCWLRNRREFLDRDRRSAMHSTDGNEFVLAGEFSAVKNLLNPSSLKRFFGFQKRQRSYLCPSCRCSQSGLIKYFTAQLDPNTRTSTNLHCFACDSDIPVERVDCEDADCKGNVRDAEDGRCLTCGNNWPHSLSDAI